MKLNFEILIKTSGKFIITPDLYMATISHYEN